MSYSDSSIERVHVSHAGFVERWGTGRVRAVPKGFPNARHFRDWRKHIRMALGRAEGGPAAPALLMPDWTALVAFLEAHQGGAARRVPPHSHISVGTLGRCASARGEGPTALADRVVPLLFEGARGAERRTLRCGLRSFNALVRRQNELPEIAPLLPAVPLALPPPVKAPAGRHRRGQAGAERLWRDYDAFARWKRENGEVRGALRHAARPRVGEATLEVYKTAVNWALAQLDRAGALPPEPRRADLVSVEALETLEDVWRDRMEAGEVSKEATTLGDRMERLVHIAGWLGVKKKGRKALAKHIEGVSKASPSRDAMSPARLALIRDFAASPRQQRAVHRMPEELRRRAEAILARWDRGEALPPSARMRALDLGTAAAMSAMLLRASCIRAANLHGMRFRGEGATLLLDHEAGPKVDVPGDQTKTGADVGGEVDEEGLPFLEWYLERICPRLVGDHPYGEGRAAADSDFLFYGPRTDAPLDRTTLEGRWRTGVAAAGLDMQLHQARHVCAYLILDQDPNAWDAAAEVLGISVTTLRAHYAWMDRRKAGRRGREHLQAARRASAKHRAGRHERDG